MNFSIKKYLLVTFILLEMLSVMAFANKAEVKSLLSSDVVSIIKPKISFSFIIARRSDCEGFGICRWTFEVSSGKINSCSGSMSVDEFNRNVILLEIDKASGISAEGYRKYFSNGTFLMEEESQIPGELVSALGLSGTKTILAGKHKVVERDGILVVSIPVR